MLGRLSTGDHRKTPVAQAPRSTGAQAPRSAGAQAPRSAGAQAQARNLGLVWFRLFACTPEVRGTCTPEVGGTCAQSDNDGRKQRVFFDALQQGQNEPSPVVPATPPLGQSAPVHHQEKQASHAEKGDITAAKGTPTCCWRRRACFARGHGGGYERGSPIRSGRACDRRLWCHQLSGVGVACGPGVGREGGLGRPGGRGCARVGGVGDLGR